ncbi:MAG: sulfatase [Prosthecobacter sp.]|uniref:sulfatase family protein n=1 Tax=Prosthecobacter sp. TaxID=1965333 RepID=UPI00390290A2
MRLTLAFLSALTFASLAELHATPAAKPNILLFLADDWGRNASCYRDPAHPSVNDVIETPNIDRVAREGVLFRHAFMGVSSCGPSRASMATGSYFWRCGKDAFLQPDPGWEINKTPNPGDALPRFGALLQEAGYKTSISGKALELDQRPPRIPLGGDGLRFSLYARKQRLGHDETAKVFEQVVRDVMQKVLSTRKPGQPFCHVLGPIGTHRPFADGSGRKLWGIDPDALKGKMPAFIPDVPEAREDYADSLGEVLALDLEVGVMLDELQNAGELDNTMLVLTGDNGVNMPRGKTHCYDIAVHAPLMIHWPAGIAKPGRVVDDFVGHIDLAPTWLEAAGITPPAGMDGRSLLPLLQSEKSGIIDLSRDHVVVGRERHEAGTRPDFMPYPMRAIRTADYLYIRNFKPDRWPCGDPYSDKGPGGDANPQGSGTVAWMVAHREETAAKPLYDLAYAKRPAEELYDLKNDTDQMHNLAAESAMADVRAKLSARLMAVLEKTNDPRLTDAFYKPPYVDPTTATLTQPKRANARKKAK